MKAEFVYFVMPVLLNVWVLSAGLVWLFLCERFK